VASVILPLAALVLCTCGSGRSRPPGQRADAGQDASRDAHDGSHTGHFVDARPDGAASFDALRSDSAAPSPLPPETMAIAGQLHGAFLELECQSEEIEFQFCIPKDMGKRSVALKFGGDAGRTYSVVLNVWAVTEAVKYKDGMKLGDHFYAGGTTGTPDTAEYGLQIAGQSYFLNHFELGAGEHYTYGYQYQTPPLRIPGAATLELFVRDPDNFVNTNHMQSEVMDPPARLRDEIARIMSQVVQGQFLYIEVQSAVPN